MLSTVSSNARSSMGTCSVAPVVVGMVFIPGEGPSHIYGCAQKLERSPRQPAGRVPDNTHEIARVADPIMHQPQQLRRKHDVFIKLLLPRASSSFSPTLFLLPCRRGCVWYISPEVRNRIKPHAVTALYVVHRAAGQRVTRICGNLVNGLLATSSRESRRKFTFFFVLSAVHTKQSRECIWGKQLLLRPSSVAA